MRSQDSLWISTENRSLLWKIKYSWRRAKVAL